ncbi:MAG: hypothetical protein JRF33_00400 [Deltaproteobacteria bacterium]|nr:hypothetical protein [Deltaproteobacteria bacterium]
MIDLHCHLLPGVDDGAQDLQNSRLMAKNLVSLGYRHVCCTPHLPWSTFTRSEAELDTLRDKLQQDLDAQGIELTLHVGAEHHSSVVGELMIDGNLVAFPRGDTFLMEFPLGGLPPGWEDLLFRLQVKGMQPVLAHVERYPEVQADYKIVQRFKERGCHILVNLTSLVGGWDRKARHVAKELVRSGLVDAVNSDMHRESEVDALREGLDELRALVGAEALEQMTLHSPAILAGIPLEEAP